MSRPVVYLHIGAMKTGTTYLQNVMLANRERLAAAGHHFAGDTWAGQVRAAQDLLALDQHDPHIAQQSHGAWDALVAEVLARRDGATIVSMEFLSFARPREVARVGRALAGADLHVVLTVRDVTATIPAQWQTSVTSGSTHTWDDFQADVRRSTGPLWPLRALRGDSGVREFRRTQDIGHIVRTWGSIVPPDRLHVVLVPAERRDDGELWRRFCVAVDVDPALAVATTSTTNPSLGHASTELVRRLNVELAGTLPWDYSHTVKAPLASKVLSARRHDEARTRLDASTVAFAGTWNARTIAAVRSAGVPVVGDLDADLPTDPQGRPTSAPPVTEDDVQAAAAHLHRGLAALVRRRSRRLARATQRPATPPTEVTGTGIDDLAALAREAMRLRRELLDAE